MRLFPLLAATLLAVASLPVHADFQYSFPKTGVTPSGNGSPPPGEGEGPGGGEPPGEGEGSPPSAPVLSVQHVDDNGGSTLVVGYCIDFLPMVSLSIDGDPVNAGNDPRLASLITQIDYSRASAGGGGVYLGFLPNGGQSDPSVVEKWTAVTSVGDSGTATHAVTTDEYGNGMGLGVCRGHDGLDEWGPEAGTWDITLHITISGGNTVTVPFPGQSFYSW